MTSIRAAAVRRAAGVWARALVIAVLASLGRAAAAPAATITGTIVDPAGKPIEFANVAAPALKRGSVADEQGRFTLELPGGRFELVVSQLGYQPFRRWVEADSASSLRVTLREQPVPVSEVVVTASSFGKVGKSEGATLRRSDIVMTPGGTADVFQALRTLPSINAPNEGAAIYVRGGEPRETLVRLDGGELGHPYHYEDASGGLFSSFDAYMIKSAFFSSGGFSARYGGVLSGVLDIESQDPANLRTVSLGANVVGGSASSSWALVPDKLSFVGSARFSRLELLSRLFGTARDYVTLPRSQDGAAKLLYRYSPTGRVSLLGLGGGDRVRVVSHRLNFQGDYLGAARNGQGLLQWQDVLAGSVALKGHLGWQDYRSQARYGVLDLVTREHNANGQLDALWELSPRQQLAFGFGVRRLESSIDGAAPADSTDFGPGAAVRTRATHPVATSPGVYLEHQLRVVGAIYATLGARADYASGSREWTADPRAAIAWRATPQQTFRVAAGRYHQLPPTADLDPIYGNPRLRPLRADHLIAGYEWKSNDANVRIEAYRKDYRDLVTTSSASYFSNGGHGFARGVDLFVQRSNRNLSGWIAYGYLDSRRREGDDPRQLPAAHGVRHALTLVGTWQTRPMLQLGARWSVASGAPTTPILGGAYDAATGRWSPIEGENHSATLPDYHRLDLRVTRLFSLPSAGALRASSVCAFYVEALNVLDEHNVLDYAYSADYSQREPVQSYFSRRMAVAGVALTW